MKPSDYQKEPHLKNENIAILTHLKSGYKLVEKKVTLKNGLDELNVLKQLDAVYFPSLVDYHFDQNEAYLYLSKINGKNLEEVKDDPAFYAEVIQNKKVVFRNAVKAVMSFHEFGFIHRDVKPSNVILDKHLNVYLIDFGCACPVNDLECIGKMAGTMTFMSPEAVFRTDLLEQTSDLFSLGKTLKWLFDKHLERLDDETIFWIHQLIEIDQQKRIKNMKELKNNIANF